MRRKSEQGKILDVVRGLSSWAGLGAMTLTEDQCAWLAERLGWITFQERAGLGRSLYVTNNEQDNVTKAIRSTDGWHLTPAGAWSVLTGLHDKFVFSRLADGDYRVCIRQTSIHSDPIAAITAAVIAVYEANGEPT